MQTAQSKDLVNDNVHWNWHGYGRTFCKRTGVKLKRWIASVLYHEESHLKYELYTSVVENLKPKPPAYNIPKTAIPNPTAASGTVVAGASPALLPEAPAPPLAVGVAPIAALALFCALFNCCLNELTSSRKLLPYAPDAVAATALRLARAAVASLLRLVRSAVGFAVSSEEARAAADAVMADRSNDEEGAESSAEDETLNAPIAISARKRILVALSIVCGFGKGILVPMPWMSLVFVDRSFCK